MKINKEIIIPTFLFLVIVSVGIIAFTTLAPVIYLPNTLPPLYIQDIRRIVCHYNTDGTYTKLYFISALQEQTYYPKLADKQDVVIYTKGHGDVNAGCPGRVILTPSHTVIPLYSPAPVK